MWYADDIALIADTEDGPQRQYTCQKMISRTSEKKMERLNHWPPITRRIRRRRYNPNNEDGNILTL